MEQSSLALLLSFFFVYSSPFKVVSALEVTPGSSCAALCLDDAAGDGFDPAASTTNTTDIVCEDAEYRSTDQGIKFRTCVECLQKSEKVNQTESDAYKFIHNVRYAVDTCLYSFPKPSTRKPVDSPCLTSYACLPLKKSFLAGDLNPDIKDQMSYCTAGDNVLQSWNFRSCIKCLQSSANQVYLSNFIIALEAACREKLAPGEILELTGSLFSETPINTTAPSFNETLPADPGASPTSLTIGTIVGIAVGGGLVLITCVALFFIYYRRQRNYRTEKDQEPLGDDPRSGGSSITVIGGGSGSHGGHYQPWTSHDHKKSNSFSSYELKQHGLSNADYYDKMEEEMRSRHYNFDPHRRDHGAGSALPTHPAYIPQAMGRTSSSRGPSPTPSALAAVAPPRSGRSDSSSIQAYRNTHGDRSLGGTPTPPYHEPSQQGLTAPPAPRAPPAAVTTAPAPAPAPAAPAQPAAAVLKNIPPPPPRAPKIPALHLPSVPRIRVPKKYTPPKIVVEDATPNLDNEEAHLVKISGPLSFRDRGQQRFRDETLQGGPVEADRAPEYGDRSYADVPINSGKSQLYG